MLRRLKKFSKPAARKSAYYTSPFHAFYSSRALARFSQFEIFLESAGYTSSVPESAVSGFLFFLEKKFLLSFKKIKDAHARFGFFF